MYQLLKSKAQHGNSKVPKSYEQNPQLGSWANKRKYWHSKKPLPSNRVLRLESIGFVWSLQKSSRWESMFQFLLEYKDQHGNTLIPRRYNKNPQLGHWVSKQTYWHSKKQLPSNCVLCLESISFVWPLQKSTLDRKKWESMFQLLLEYKGQHGNTLVPSKYNKNPQFGKWVQHQRHFYSKKELSSNLVLRLESIGFVWCVQILIVDTNWDAMYQLLLEYKDQHGSTLVPAKYNKNAQLGNWVGTQRKFHSKEQLSSNRVLRLKSIGFVFDAYENNWMHMYHRLCSYKEKHGGSTTVPRLYAKDPSLGFWVKLQRCKCKQKDRVKLLDDIGFVWDAVRK